MDALVVEQVNNVEHTAFLLFLKCRMFYQIAKRLQNKRTVTFLS